MRKSDYFHLLLRIGLAFSLIYASIAAFVNPVAWVGFVPAFVESFMTPEAFLMVWGIIEIIWGLWILSGWNVRYPAIAVAITVLGLIIFNTAQIDILFRDITVLILAIALAVNPE